MVDYQAIYRGEVLLTGSSGVGAARYAVVRRSASGELSWVGAYYNLGPAEKAMHRNTVGGATCLLCHATPVLATQANHTLG